jgi:hypothetical protein
MQQLARESRALATRLQAWRQQERATVSLPAPLAGLGSPEIGAVTSASPRSMARLSSLLGSLLFIAMLAAGTSLLFGLSFDPSQGGPAWYVIGVASLIVVFGLLPYFLYREPKR